MSWATKELEKVDLGDTRRNRRLVKIVEDLAGNPESSIPQASRDAAAIQAAYDFFNNPRVKAEAIATAHRKSTVERAKEHSLVLAVQDTTELDYSNHKGKRGIGPIGKSSAQGLKIHSVLCVSDKGVPIGIINQQIWARENQTERPKKAARKKAIADKESNRWLEGIEIAQQEIPSAIRVVMVGDREADIYELFAMPKRIGSEFLIRAYQNRQVKTRTNQSEAQKIQSAIQKTKPAGHLQLKLQRTPSRKARIANLTVRFATYLLQPPKNHENQNLEPIKVQVILAQEETPPTGEKPVSWLLITTLPVNELSQACLCLKWYTFRWLIERYHFVLKSGCRVEKLQLETKERLIRALVTYAIVAWRLLWLTYQARINPEKPVDQIFETHEWLALYSKIYQTDLPPQKPPSLHQCVGWLARLGGFLGRKGDGEPGVKTIWIGLRKLHQIVETWLITHPEYAR